MLVAQLYLNGACSEAIEVYQQAFKTEIDSIMYDPDKEPDQFVFHAEMHILGTRVMLSDFGGQKCAGAESTMELVAVFENEEALREAYNILIDGGTIITPIGPTFYSVCLTSLTDRFGVRWCFMV
ncbi:VOC family protein [Paenibacillus sp. MMS20-IR301]|uniref:VOC family protein n=1 Tax=Paenibacillus sp. MMS20-IR301 TaxID=2895946 RepID=UPI0028E353E6|nr:VOC family protein [Paenibacillus sp. MMS20-IR301]WNS45126.1 hypothetical protein LOS79_07615 [Paenibacillus sp. MMS20-IR301]